VPIIIKVVSLIPAHGFLGAYIYLIKKIVRYFDEVSSFLHW